MCGVIAKAVIVQVEVLSVPNHVPRDLDQKYIHLVHVHILHQGREMNRKFAGNRQCSSNYHLHPDSSCLQQKRVS